MSNLLNRVFMSQCLSAHRVQAVTGVSLVIVLVCLLAFPSFASTEAVQGYSSASTTTTSDDEYWMEGFNRPGVDGGVRAFATDDSNNLFVGGSFSSAGGVPSNSVARWDGTSWYPLGSGLSGDWVEVNALVVGPDGALYAAGHFSAAGGVAASNIARWDGLDWSPLGSGIGGGFTYTAVFALTFGPDGSLYAGGNFNTAGGVAANFIARWDGATWYPLVNEIGGMVNALEFGSDDTLYAGGSFHTAGGVAVNNIARWDGTIWHDVGGGVDEEVLSLAFGPDDSLYVGGFFFTAGDISAPGIARWDGAAWHPLGTGTDYEAIPGALEFGPTGILYAGGYIYLTGGLEYSVARWEGATWHPIGNGLDGVGALTFSSDGSLYAGGTFEDAGEVEANSVAQWDGEAWHPLGNGFSSATVLSLALGPDSLLYAGGWFSSFPGASRKGINRWNGTNWHAIGDTSWGYVNALAFGPDGSLYVGGYFSTIDGVAANSIARWDGTAWQSLDSGMGGDFPQVHALAFGPDGSLYAGFNDFFGSEFAIARWDGSQWHPLGSGTYGWVYALTVGPDGSLYAGGLFNTAGGVITNGIARWDGMAWHPLGSGIIGTVYALAFGPDDSLYVGGTFLTAGGTDVFHVARWDGMTWHSLGIGMDDSVRTLAFSSHGSLYAGGEFTMSGGVVTNGIARWDGTAWRAMGSGMGGGTGSGVTVGSLAFLGDDSLFVAGEFTAAGGKPSSKIAQWIGDVDPWTIRQATPLTLGIAVDGQNGRMMFSDYSIEVDPGLSLLVEVDPLDTQWPLLVISRLRDYPNLTTYESRTGQPTARNVYELLITPTQTGTYYFSIFSTQAYQYRITARAVQHRFSSLAPRSGSNAGQTALGLTGLNFVEGMHVELRGAGLPTYTSNDVVLISSTNLSTNFDLVGATVGTYDVRAAWPNGYEEVIPGAFQINPGIGPRLSAYLEAPEYVRPGRGYALTVNYANRGDANLTAPLLLLSNQDNAKMRQTGTMFYDDRPVQMMGISLNGLAGVVPAGATGTANVEFIVANADEFLDFDLEVMVADNTQIDWNAVASEIRPPDISNELWNVFWSMLTSQIGSTWADYNNALATNASYLSTLGRKVSAVRDLFRFEVRKALGMAPRNILAESLDASVPTPGLPLRFGRVFPGNLEGRFYVGPLGYGWSHSYDIYAEELSDASVRIHAPGALIRAFHRNPDGTYSGLAGEHATLVRVGGLFQLTEKDGLVHRFRNDGKFSTIQDTRGNAITAAYDGSGRLVQVSHSNGDSFVLAYNAQGRLASLTDHAGRATQFAYDGSGQHLLSVTAPGSRTTTYTYSPTVGAPASHALQSVAFPDGTHQFYSYDSQGRLVEEQKDGGAERVTYAYDGAGRITTTDASGAAAVISPDEAGRPSRLKDGLGSDLNLVYDSQYNLTGMRDQAGQPYSFSYDHLGNVLGTQDPEGNRLTLGYDYRFSQLSLLRDARGNKSRFGYDAAGNLTMLTYPDGSQEILTYDAAGNPTSFRNRAGQTIQYTYNARGQVARKDYSDGSWAAYTYDAAGNMTSAADANGAIAMEYDPTTDRLTRITYPSGHFFSYTYNAAGLRTRRTDQDGKQIYYEYDAAGRLARMADESNATIVTYQYDGVGRVSRKSLGNGTYATYEYDAVGQITHLVHHKADGTILSRFDYTYDALGNRTSMTTLEGITSYTYDTLRQLTGVTYPDGRQETYFYDGAGNRTIVAENGAPTAYTTNRLNQYTHVGGATYAYDASGNLISKTEGSQTTTYHYDFENRLVRVDTPSSSVSYAYDPTGRRIARTDADGTVRYLNDGDHVATELDASNAVTARYTHGAALDEVLTMERGGSIYWYNLDALGSVRSLTTAGAQVLESYDYNPYGQPSTGSVVENPWFFTGREFDTDTFLLFNRRRFYSPVIGRFTTVDPINILGGVNLYEYASNNPTTMTDPFGLVSPEDYGLIPDADDMRAYIRRNNPSGAGEADLFTDRSSRPKRVNIYDPDIRRLIYENNMSVVEIEPVEIDESLRQLLDVHDATIVYPRDPNEKVGPSGTGNDRLIRRGEDLEYTVYFENLPAASAPAQEVFLTDYLDPNLDWTTFHPTEIAFGDVVIPIVDGTYQFASLQTIPDYRPESNKAWWVDITAELNPFTGRARWVFRTLDPDTGELPQDPFAGFLPPNDASGRGEGHVTFSVRPSQAAPNGTVLSNSASIIFDTELPIQTNTVTNTIGICADIVPPDGIGIEDIQSVAGRWGLSSGDPGWDDLYDLDGDGEITVQDIIAAAEGWGQTCQ